MNYLWRIDSYVVTISMYNSNPLNIIIFIILRVQFQIFSGVILELIILIFLIKVLTNCQNYWTLKL